MPKYCMKYYETYYDWYDIEAPNEDAARSALERKILTKELEGPKNWKEAGAVVLYKYKDEEEPDMQRCEYAVQVCYERQYGYETVATEDTMEDAERTLKDYRENEPQYPSRIVRRKVKK